MGIKDLYKVIKEESSEQILELTFSELNGFMFAVDISSILYKYVKSGEEWEFNFLYLFALFKSYGINCICVFDGGEVTPEKQLVKDKRRKELEIRTQKVKQAEHLLKSECDVGDFFKNMRIGAGLPDKERLGLFVEKASKQVEPVTKEHSSRAKELLGMLGVTFIQVKGEADGHCVWLVKNGFANAVLSEDTDMLAYGCPILFSFKNFKVSDRKLYGIHLKSLLESMNLLFSEFQDLCILLSCDYNKRIKLESESKKIVSIGWVRALSIIKKYKTLEFSKSQNVFINYEDLKVEVCRKYFNDDYMCKDFVKSSMNKEDLATFMRSKELNPDLILNLLKPPQLIIV